METEGPLQIFTNVLQLPGEIFRSEYMLLNRVINLHVLTIFHYTLEVVCGIGKAAILGCVISAVGSLTLEFCFPRGKVKMAVGKRKRGRYSK